MAEIGIRRLTDRALVRVIARRGAVLPSFAPDRALPTGPGEVLVMREGAEGEALEAELASALAAVATVCDQTDAFALFSISGAGRDELLARLVPIDIEGGSLPPEGAAATILHHMAVLLWREDESVVVAGVSSSAGSLADATETAKVGLQVSWSSKSFNSS